MTMTGISEITTILRKSDDDESHHPLLVEDGEYRASGPRRSRWMSFRWLRRAAAPPRVLTHTQKDTHDELA